MSILIFAACTPGQASGPIQFGEPTTTTFASPREVPDIDTRNHNVPLDQVVFDTFDGRTVSLPESRARLLDTIPPIDNPVYAGPAGGDWLDPDDLVLGYVAADTAYAYPFKILNYHEIVNDELAGIPVLVSYCPLCRSAIVYDRRVDGELLDFGNTSALYESDLAMVDRSTGSYWWQVAGEAIVGPLTGTALTPLPSSVARWEDWVELHPGTRVLSRETGFDRPYTNDPFLNYSEQIDAGRFPFQVGEPERDERLTASTMVVGVEIDEARRVYALPISERVINDIVAGTVVVLFSRGNGETAAVFSPVIDGEPLEFNHVDGSYVDTTTESVWSAAGEATDGPLKGQQLAAIPSRTTFWFAYIAAFPDAELYQG